MATEPAPSSAAPAHRTPRPVLWVLGLVRLLMLIGILFVLVAAVALLVMGAVETWRLTTRLVVPAGAPLKKEELMLASIMLVDLALLATVLYIVAIGLYELFIDSRIPVPAWLRIEGIDDLKHKLIGVVITVMGVMFLEQVIAWDGNRNLLPFGLAIAVVILALSLFLGTGSDKGKSAGGDR